MTWLISDEARKHRAFREVWVAYLLGGLYLLLGLYTEISEQNYSVLYTACSMMHSKSGILFSRISIPMARR